MKLISFFLVLALTNNYSLTSRSTINTDDLNGTWVPVKQEFAGDPLPAEAFENQKLIISDSNYTVIAENVDKGTVRYTGNKIDIYSKEGPNEGRHFTAIYKLEKKPSGDPELTICYNLNGDAYPQQFGTRDQPMYFMSVFKKETAK